MSLVAGFSVLVLRWTITMTGLLYCRYFPHGMSYALLVPPPCQCWDSCAINIIQGMFIEMEFSSIYLYTLAVSHSLGGSRQHRRNNKTMGISLRSSGNDEGPSRVWMALLEQHSPSSPVLHNLRRFIYAISPTAPTTGLTL